MIQILNASEITDTDILARNAEKANVSSIVAEIIADVRKNGDEALLRYERKFGCPKLASIEVTEAEFDEAERAVPEKLLSAMRRSAENIVAFHEKQVRTGFAITQENGVVLGQRIQPIERVGLYVPGGTASYPSTVLMNAIPAKLAGCPEILLCSPAGRDGTIAPAILVAARIAGVSRFFKLGGAQAVAAMAYGTKTVPRVYKITGPGNAFVAEAKRQVFGQVAIDMIAGPSEILIVSDGKNEPRVLAADLLSQAEHDALSSAVLITVCEKEAAAVQMALETQLSALPRAEIARKSIDANGKIILCASVEEAVKLSNRIAPEHLELAVEEPFALLGRVTNAGSVFLGRSTPEALGDYFAGPNHTLPTMGTARFSSPLSVDDFVKKSAFTYYPSAALSAVADDITVFAESEGLSAHARSVQKRFE